MILSGMGEIHIEATVDKLRRKFAVEVNLKLPKVSYKETIKGKARVQGRYKKQSGGRGQYGDCWIEIEALPRGRGIPFLRQDRRRRHSRSSISRLLRRGSRKPVSTVRWPVFPPWTSRWTSWTGPSIPWIRRKWRSRSRAPWLSRKP